MYVAETGSDKIRKVSPGGVVTTVYDGSYLGTDDIDTPRDIAVDAEGNIYVVSRITDPIQKISPAGVVTTVSDFTKPTSVEVDASGTLYVAMEDAGIGRAI